MKYVVLGGYGIIGKVVVLDLFKTCKNCEIIVAGRDLKKAVECANSYKSSRVKAAKVDIKNINQTAKLLKDADVAVNCVQYYFNTTIMKACIKAKTNYVDLGGLFHETKKQLRLHSKFKKINRLAIPGCGGTPGITNVLAAYGATFLKKFNSIEMYFADKDDTKYNQPFVLPYSFETIIDEYTKKPAVFKNGKLIFVEPHSGTKEYMLKDYGKLKGFYSLHSELATFPSSFKDKKLKNCEFRVTFEEEFSRVIQTLTELGFTSKKAVRFDDKKIPIIAVTAVIMDQWLLKPGTKIKDKELLRVDFDKGKLVIDSISNSRFNVPGGTYNVGVPCSIVAQMIPEMNSKGISGVLPPERAINPEIFFKELKKRGIFVLKNGKEVN